MENKKNIKRSLIRILYVILGSAILGLGAGFFLGPHNIVSGGLTGIGIIFQALFNWNLDTVVWVLQIAFFFLGFIFLGKNMALKTIVATIVYPATLTLGGYLASLDILGFSNFFESSNAMGQILAAVFGGVFVGAGVGLTFLGGGSTGGVDILVLIIQKFTKSKTSKLTFLVDGLIVLAGLAAMGDIGITLIGIVSAFITAIMIDKIFDTENNVIVSIISKKYAELNKIILEKLDRGSTIVDATGGYSQQGVKMLQVVLERREYYVLEDIIAEEDPQAFMFMSKVSSVRGEGFKAHTKALSNLGNKK